MYEDSFPWFWAKTIFEIFWPFYRRNSLRNGKSLKMQWWHRTKLMSKWPKNFWGPQKNFWQLNRFKRILGSRVLVFLPEMADIRPLIWKILRIFGPLRNKQRPNFGRFWPKNMIFRNFFSKIFGRFYDSARSQNFSFVPSMAQNISLRTKKGPEIVTTLLSAPHAKMHFKH